MQANGDPPLVATLVFPCRGSRIMLATKMKGIGSGYLNGWGGGVEEGESVDECAVREFREETLGAEISIKNLRLKGVVHFKNHKKDGGVVNCDVYVYVVHTWSGEICSTEDMKDPVWYNIYELGRLHLMPGDKFWLQNFIRGKKMRAWVEYAPGQKILLSPVVVRSGVNR